MTASTGSAGTRVHAAARSAARALPSDRRVGEPCATCPKPAGPDTEFDGALIGAGCTALTDPRARGQLRPRQVVDHVEPGRPDALGGYTPPVTVLKDDPRDAGRQRQRVSRVDAEMARARAVTPSNACCHARQAKAGRHGDDWGPRTIVYVNGINTDRQGHCDTLRAIADATCARVIGVYNATEGMTTDLLQVAKDRSLIKDAAAGRPFAVGDRRNPAADTMSDLIVAEAKAGRPVEVWAHSQGGAVASLSLYDARRVLQRGNNANPLGGIDVNSFASAAPSWVAGPEYRHYIHTGDLVPVYTGLGRGPYLPAAVGGHANVVRFAEERAGVRRRFVWSGSEIPGSGQAELHAVVPNQRIAATANHGMDSVYLPLYQQRLGELGEPVCTDHKR